MAHVVHACDPGPEPSTAVQLARRRPESIYSACPTGDPLRRDKTTSIPSDL
jgi:hypothetical protein